jgi:enamine deaminase RidA (YjgF/YER057c/UK114 family)
MEGGVPQLAETFEEQLALVGEYVTRVLARYACTTADIVDATVRLHPSVDTDPGDLLDQLQAHVFLDSAPTLSVARAAAAFDDSLVSVKVIAYKPR